MDPIDLTGFECPRCGQTVGQDFYGPCTDCRTKLRSQYTSEQTPVETTEYEPKMNVTPNAVATKD